MEHTVALCAGIYDALGVVCEAGEVDAILLALQLFGMLALLTVVDLQDVIVLRDQAELAGVVKVERGDGEGFLAGACAKALLSREVSLHGSEKRSRLTREGAKFWTTSETFAAGGPALGFCGLAMV